MKIKKAAYMTVLLFSTTAIMATLFSGCGSMEMNRIENSYSNRKVEKLAAEYLEEKYGVTPEMGEIETYDDVCGGIDATSFVAFRGFVIETDDYLTFMEFEEDGTYTFSDNKQAEEIEEAMRQELKSAYDGEAYLTMAYPKLASANDGNTPLPYVSDVEHSYTEYFDGDIAGVLSKEEEEYGRYHNTSIYLPPVEHPGEVVRQLIGHFENISSRVEIYVYEPGIYEELQPCFDDYDFMCEYDEEAYSMASGNTYYGGDSVKEHSFQKIAEGLYVKCQTEVTLYEDAEAGLKTLIERNPDGKEAEYQMTGEEKFFLLAQDDSTILLLVDPEKIEEPYRFFTIYGEGELVEEEGIRDEMLMKYPGISEDAYTVQGLWGYLLAD